MCLAGDAQGAGRTPEQISAREGQSFRSSAFLSRKRKLIMAAGEVATIRKPSLRRRPVESRAGKAYRAGEIATLTLPCMTVSMPRASLGFFWL